MNDFNRESGVFRSRFGGLWIDRSDAMQVLERKVSSGEIAPAEAPAHRTFIEKGYVVFERAVPPAVIDEYLELFERAWKKPPPGIYVHSLGEVVPLGGDLRDRIAKVSDLHYYFKRAGEIAFPPVVARFLEQVYERPPVVFQSMTMRKGTEESLHTDTGPLSLTEPMSLTASWLALEDIRPDSGPLQFIPGSHRLPEVLNNGVTKAHNGDMGAYHTVLQTYLKLAAERGMPTEHFHAKKGDVLIWAADLMHGGAKIVNQAATRLSLVCHYMPLGVMPTFYDFSKVNYLKYPGAGYYLDRIKPVPY